VALLQPYLRQLFGRIADLGDKRRALSSALASVAAFSAIDPWHNGGWLFGFMESAEAEDRACWADEFGQCLESLSDEGIDGIWTRWLSDYWRARITGVPRPLAEDERGSVITWVPGLRSKFSEAVDLVLAARPSTLDHTTFYRLDQAEIAVKNGRETGRLLRGLLAELDSVAYDSGEVAMLANAAADNGAERADLLAIADDMARLGCSGAAGLRDRANL
jgi:hypothetical protein